MKSPTEQMVDKKEEIREECPLKTAGERMSIQLKHRMQSYEDMRKKKRKKVEIKGGIKEGCHLVDY